MGKVIASCVLRAVVCQAFEFVPILPVVVKALYVQMSVLFVDLQTVEMLKECAEVLKGRYKISCTAGAVPSPACPCDDVTVVFQSVFEDCGKIFPVCFVLCGDLFPNHIVRYVVYIRPVLAFAERFIYRLFCFVVFGIVVRAVVKDNFFLFYFSSPHNVSDILFRLFVNRAKAACPH